MTQRRSFWRKVGYVSAIVVLLIPLSWLSMPATSSQGQERPGGKLAAMRQEHGLSQANLGEIDPASETMKLATLGLRGLAVNILWEKAIHYKKVEDWTNFEAKLEQIRHLQPNYITVWTHQAWNLSYNLSVEFDDYRDRYRWVMRGIDYLQEGLKYNRDEPRLLWEVGWFIAQKIGRSDERVQYRRLFKADPDFHAGSNRTKEQRDNWLVAKDWYKRAIDVDASGVKKMKGKGPLIFKADPGLCQMNYAEMIQEEGTHGQTARRAWAQAQADWHEFGEQNILHSEGYYVQLNHLQRLRNESASLQKKMEGMSAGISDEIVADRVRAMTPDELELLHAKQADVPPESQSEYFAVQERVKIKPSDIAQRIEETKPELAMEATRLSRQWLEVERTARGADNYRSQINFDYWEDRCKFELTPEVARAAELDYQAQAAHEEQELVRARELYEQAWPLWKKAFDAFPKIYEEGNIGEELVDHIKRYHDVLEDQSAEFPQDFILREVIERFDTMGKLRGVLIATSEESESEAEKPDPDQPPTGEPAQPDAQPSEGTPPEPPEDPADSTPAPPEEPVERLPDESSSEPPVEVPEEPPVEAPEGPPIEAPAEPIEEAPEGTPPEPPSQ